MTRTKPLTRKPRTRKTPLKTLKRKAWSSRRADQEFSRYIRARDPFCYFGCGNPSSQASHFWGRGHSSTRYHPLNVDGACGGCHMRHEGNKQGTYRTLKLQQLGRKGYNDLMRLAQSTVKRSDAIVKLIAFLQSENHQM